MEPVFVTKQRCSISSKTTWRWFFKGGIKSIAESLDRACSRRCG